ncbi:MAG: Gfo/Idh/MocA family oxidoreductase [Deltaproteobacteria bacterium]|nr:Gfo/Idh/MocA family oxidoreductase [Deltaproteobacteria bacterium]MBI3075438.1 Gfo/Idh/MocA family oxidoreductase [Deltaproteobacteria bacterium]
MIGIGVIGCGYWGPNLLRNFYELESCRLTWCCDARPERLRWVQGRYPTVRTTTSWEELLRAPDVQAVAIATPVSTHARLAREALRRGKDVLVEKPLTASVREAEALVALAEQERRILMVDHVFVYSGAVRAVKEVIRRGELGDLYYFDSVRVNLGLFQHDVNVLWDLAPHDLAIMDYLLELEPEAVMAVGACNVGTGIENLAYVTIRFAGHLLAHIHVNWLAPVKARRTLLCGSRKMIIYDDTEPSEKVKVYDRGITFNGDQSLIHQALIEYRTGDMYAPRIEPTEALRRVCGHFLECVEARKAPLTDGEAGLRVVRLLERAEASMRAGGVEQRLVA